MFLKELRDGERVLDISIIRRDGTETAKSQLVALQPTAIVLVRHCAAIVAEAQFRFHCARVFASTILVRINWKAKVRDQSSDQQF